MWILGILGHPPLALSIDLSPLRDTTGKTGWMTAVLLWSVDAELYPRPALLRPTPSMKVTAQVNIAHFFKTHILKWCCACGYLNQCVWCQGVLPIKVCWWRKHMIQSEAAWNIDVGFLFFLMLYLTAHLDGSIFLTLNIHCLVEYDQGSAKEDHFVTREGGREGRGGGWGGGCWEGLNNRFLPPTDGRLAAWI